MYYLLLLICYLLLLFATIDILLATIDIDKGFKFQPDVCNGCDDVLMMSTNFNDIAIWNILGVVYRCIINGINKSEAVYLL